MTRKHEITPSKELLELKGIEAVDGKPSRRCPSCGIIILYETLKGYEYSEKQQASCASCGAKKPTLSVPPDLVRACPRCAGLIQYKSAQSWRQAEKSSRSCRVCSDKATRTTTRSDEWRSWRSEKYRRLCEDPSSPVRAAYDALQDERAHIGNVSSKERTLLTALEPLGYTAGKVDRWRCDSVNHEAKIVVEHHGDWWHVRPGSRHERVIREEYNGIHPLSKTTIEEIWARDTAKAHAVENLGYSYIVVWESDLEEWLSWINSSLLVAKV